MQPKYGNMQNSAVKRFLSVGALLTLLPACRLPDMFKGKEGMSEAKSDNSATVISFGNKVVVTGNDFDKQLKMLFAANPQIEQYVTQLPESAQEQLYGQVTDSLVTQKLAIEFVKDKGLDQTPDYKERARDAHRSIDDQLAVKALEEVIVKQATEQAEKLSDQDLEKFYNDNKEKNSMFHCQPFLKNDPKRGDTTKDFAPFAEVRDMVRRLAFQERLNEVYLNEIQELKKKYDVKVNTDYTRKFIIKQQPAAVQAEEDATLQQSTAPAIA